PAAAIEDASDVDEVARRDELQVDRGRGGRDADLVEADAAALEEDEQVLLVAVARLDDVLVAPHAHRAAELRIEAMDLEVGVEERRVDLVRLHHRVADE